MNALDTVARRVSSLVHGDQFTYGGETVTVQAITRINGAFASGGALFEATVVGQDSDQVRYLDYAQHEEVVLVGGPTLLAAQAEVRSTPQPSATRVALLAVREGRTRSLTVSANAVLYAAAAVCDEGVGIAHEGEIASAAGLATSTVRGILRSLESKGLVRRRSVGWSVL